MAHQCYNLPFTGFNDDYKQALIAHKPTVKLIKSGDGYTLCSTKPDKTTQEDHFVPGVEFDEIVGPKTVSIHTNDLSGSMVFNVAFG